MGTAGTDEVAPREPATPESRAPASVPADQAPASPEPEPEVRRAPPPLPARPPRGPPPLPSGTPRRDRGAEASRRDRPFAAFFAEFGPSAPPSPAPEAPRTTPRAPPARSSDSRLDEAGVLAGTRHREVRSAGARPDLDRDVALARARVLRSPDSPTARYRLGKLLLQRSEGEDLNEALSNLGRLVEIEPNHPGAHHAVAEAHAREGRLDLAREHLQRARRLGYTIDGELEQLLSSNPKVS